MTTFIYAAYGARAVLLRVTYDTAGFGQWVHQLQQRTAHNKGIVAIANKLARIAWAVLFKGEISTLVPSAHALRTAVEKMLRLQGAVRFPLFHRRGDDEMNLTGGPLRREQDERTFKQRAGKPELRNGLP